MVTGESAEEAVKPLRREGRRRLYLWFCRVLFVARGPWVRWAPGLPCALLFSRDVFLARLGQIMPRDRGCVTQRVMKLDRRYSSGGSALPLPLFAGEGWGGGASAKRTGREDRPSPTRRALASAIAEAQLRRSILGRPPTAACAPPQAGEVNPLREKRELRSDPAFYFAARWIASLALAMTALRSMTIESQDSERRAPAARRFSQSSSPAKAGDPVLRGVSD